MLTYAEARAYYDRFGAKQDAQAWYEDPAVEALVRHSEFDHAQAVFEFGCGTGRLAHKLLTHSLPANARYLGVDLSHTMVQLARERLVPFGERAQATLSEGAPQVALPDHSVDRYLSTYVFDLLTQADMAAALTEAHRLLAAEGKLCLVSLTYGERGWARSVSWGWERIHSVSPSRFGGCRPIRLVDALAPTQWQIQHRALIPVANITSEVIVAVPLP